MRLEERGSLRILTPEVGYKLYSVKTNEYYTKVYLGKFDSVDNYREIGFSIISDDGIPVSDETIW